MLRPLPEPESESYLACLLADHAAPIIKGIIGRKLQSRENDHAAEAEDLYADVIVQLITRLRKLISNPEENSIGDFCGYVAVTAYNACNLYLRRKYPSRWRLKNRLRYLLSRSSDFALWESADGDSLCGLSTWRDRKQGLKGRAWQLQLTEKPDALKRAGLATGPPHAALPDLVHAVFRHIGSPVCLDELLRVVADLQGVHDQLVVVDIADEENSVLRASETKVAPSFATEVEQRSYLRRLWTEIIQHTTAETTRPATWRLPLQVSGM